MASQAEVMVTAHDSWDRKQALANELRRVAAALAENIYSEYSTFRGCSSEAAYREARDQVRGYLIGAQDAADNAVSKRLIEEGRR